MVWLALIGCRPQVAPEPSPPIENEAPPPVEWPIEAVEPFHGTDWTDACEVVPPPEWVRIDGPWDGGITPWFVSHDGNGLILTDGVRSWLVLGLGHAEIGAPLSFVAADCSVLTSSSRVEVAGVAFNTGPGTVVTSASTERSGAWRAFAIGPNYGGVVAVADSAEVERVWPAAADVGFLQHAHVSPDGERAFLKYGGASEHEWYLVDLGTGDVLTESPFVTAPADVYMLRSSADGRTWLGLDIPSDDSRPTSLFRLDVPSDRVDVLVHGDAIRGRPIAVSGDGRIVAVATEDEGAGHHLEVHDTDDDTVREVHAPWEGAPRHVAMNADATWVAVSAEDGLWLGPVP